MNELSLIRQEHFGEIKCDVYGSGNEVYMTSEQLGECLGYSNGRKGIDNLLDRYEYLKESEFSVTLKLRATDGKMYNTRVFTEDGIYEVTMLSKTDRAREFRSWFRKLLKALRSGKAKLVGMTDYQKIMAQTRVENARIRKAQMYAHLADKYKGASYAQVLDAYATKELSGEFLIPLPELKARTYSAEEVGKIIGCSANMVGRIANSNGLKTPEYGEWFKDKSKYGDKEVSSFRYYDTVLPVMKNLL